MTASTTAPSRATVPRAEAAASASLFGPGVRTVRLGGLSLHISVRAVLVTALLTAAALCLGWWNLISGSAALGATDAFAALTGTADEGTARVILDWRAPRVVFTLFGGAALAVAGAVFQSQTRNPLGSPDIIGFSAGAYTGALLVAAAGLTGVWATPTGAVIGGLATGVVVYLLAAQRSLGGGPRISGMRIIIVGIGVSIFLGALNTYLLTTLRLETAMSAATWGAGSVNDIAWAHVLPLLALLSICGPAMLAAARSMTLMEMGDDAASGLGVPLEGVRILMFGTAILLVAVVTAAAGPIAFIALVAPQLALRLTGAASVHLVPAAAMGALLLTAADAVARAEAMPVSVPVGVVTLILGGAYLVWLLIVMGRRRKV